MRRNQVQDDAGRPVVQPPRTRDENRPAAGSVAVQPDAAAPTRGLRRPGDAAGHFTWLTAFLGLDIPASSTLTRELTGWQPTQPGLIEDLEKGHHFRSVNGRPSPA